MNDFENPMKRNITSWVWALALFGIVFIVAGAFIVNKFLSIPENTGNIIKDIFKPHVKYETIVLGTIGAIKKESKFVVQTVEINLSIEKSSTKTLFWDKLDLGTTVVEMQITGNKVQYFIPLEKISAANFQWDEKKGEVVIDVPMPKLDEDIVEVQSNPDKIKIKKDIGWARLDSNSGKFLENEIKRDLRNKVIEEGKKKILLEEAQRNAGKAILDLFKLKMKMENVAFPVRTNIN